MRLDFHVAAVAAVLAGLAAASALPASAACTRLAFSVNDYGKEGPSNDAKRLLDTYIAKKMQERGVASYKTGKKLVTCELYIDLILFDEYTCKAEATVCWDGSTPAGGAQQATAPKSTPADEAKTTTGSIDNDAAVTAPESAPAAVAAPEAAPTPEPVRAVEAPASAPAAADVSTAPAVTAPAAPSASVEAVAPVDEAEDAGAPASVAP